MFIARSSFSGGARVISGARSGSFGGTKAISGFRSSMSSTRVSTPKVSTPRVSTPKTTTRTTTPSSYTHVQAPATTYHSNSGFYLGWLVGRGTSNNNNVRTMTGTPTPIPAQSNVQGGNVLGGLLTFIGIIVVVFICGMLALFMESRR